VKIRDCNTLPSSSGFGIDEAVSGTLLYDGHAEGQAKKSCMENKGMANKDILARTPAGYVQQLLQGNRK